MPESSAPPESPERDPACAVPVTSAMEPAAGRPAARALSSPDAFAHSRRCAPLRTASGFMPAMNACQHCTHRPATPARCRSIEPGMDGSSQAGTARAPGLCPVGSLGVNPPSKTVTRGRPLRLSPSVATSPAWKRPCPSERVNLRCGGRYPGKPSVGVRRESNTCRSRANRTVRTGIFGARLRSDNGS